MHSSDRSQPRPGSTLDGRFVVQEVLGTGGMGVVVAAQDLGLREQVAIKLLHSDLVRSGDTVTRFLREARASARLRSEHVVHVMDVGTLSSGIPYFVMEYLPGADLGVLLEDGGALPFEDVIDYALQALEALAEAHRLGIVHRDLKPANLFLTTREDDTAFIKVLDFGISKLSGWEVSGDGTITRQGTIFGSPLYMAPEQIRDASSVDARSDIWSLGAVMHELLTGRPPFEANDVPGVIHEIFHTLYEPPLEVDLPQELVNILMRCLRKSRDDRYPDVEALARAFQPLAHSSSTQLSIERILRAPPRPSAPSLRTPDDELDELQRSTVETDGGSYEPVERDTLPSIPVGQRRPRWAPAGFALAGLIAGVLFVVVTRSQRENPGLAPPTAEPAAASPEPAVAIPETATTPRALTDAAPSPSALAAPSSSAVRQPSPHVAASAHPKPKPASSAPPTSSAPDPQTVTPSKPSPRVLDVDNPFAK